MLFLPAGAARLRLHLLFLLFSFCSLCALDVVDRCFCLVFSGVCLLRAFLLCACLVLLCSFMLLFLFGDLIGCLTLIRPSFPQSLFLACPVHGGLVHVVASGASAFLVLRVVACRIDLAFLLPLPASAEIGVIGLHLVLMYLVMFFLLFLPLGWVSGVSRWSRLFFLFCCARCSFCSPSSRGGMCSDWFSISSSSIFFQFLVRACLVHGGHIRVAASGFVVLDVLFLPAGIACLHLHPHFIFALLGSLRALDVIDHCFCLACFRGLLDACSHSLRLPGLPMFIHVDVSCSCLCFGG